MLLKLLPEQVCKYWDVIGDTIAKSLPPTVIVSTNRLNNILNNVMLGVVQCWVSYKEVNGEMRIHGIATTKVVEDEASRVRNLDIYTLYGIQNMEIDEWSEALQALKKFGAANGCHRIIGRTNIPGLVKACKRLGAEVEYTLISFPINGE